MALSIANFSLDIDDWDYASSSSISVDIVDLVHTVVESGCYITINDAAVSFTSSSITDGYKLIYDPGDNFTSLSGVAKLTVAGSNDNLDVIQDYFYVTFGYIVEYENGLLKDWDFGPSTGVTVRVSAEDMVSCSSNAEAIWFETKALTNNNLGATIVGVLPEEVGSSAQVSASIYPQSTAFFYGKTYRVVLNARDLAGNIMEPLEFEFKIEDKP